MHAPPKPQLQAILMLRPCDPIPARSPPPPTSHFTPEAVFGFVSEVGVCYIPHGVLRTPRRRLVASE